MSINKLLIALALGLALTACAKQEAEVVAEEAAPAAEGEEAAAPAAEEAPAA